MNAISRRLRQGGLVNQRITLLLRLPISRFENGPLLRAVLAVLRSSFNLCLQLGLRCFQ